MMIIFNNYAQYKRALAAGHRDIKFESLKDSTLKLHNPITTDRGVGAVAVQSGDYWLTPT